MARYVAYCMNNKIFYAGNSMSSTDVEHAKMYDTPKKAVAAMRAWGRRCPFWFGVPLGSMYDGRGGPHLHNLNIVPMEVQFTAVKVEEPLPPSKGILR